MPNVATKKLKIAHYPARGSGVTAALLAAPSRLPIPWAAMPEPGHHGAPVPSTPTPMMVRNGFGPKYHRTSRTIGGPTKHPTATIVVRMNNERRENCGRGMANRNRR